VSQDKKPKGRGISIVNTKSPQIQVGFFDGTGSTEPIGKHFLITRGGGGIITSVDCV